jgi:hypothetical protein
MMPVLQSVACDVPLLLQGIFCAKHAADIGGLRKTALTQNME